MGAQYLTKSGDAYLFQIRLPREIDPRFELAPIRVRLGVMPNSRARRYADVLGGAARIAFERARRNMETTADSRSIRRNVEEQIKQTVPLLRGLAVLGTSSLPPDILTPAADTTFDELALIGARAEPQPSPESKPRPDHAAPLLAVLRDENLARQYLGMAPNPAGAAASHGAAAIAAAVAGQKSKAIPAGHAPGD